MFRKLSAKIFFWLLCNLLILLLAGACVALYIFLAHGNGLVPASYFSRDVDHLFKTVSVDLQNRPTRAWQEILERYNREGLRLHLVSMDDKWLYFGGDFVPAKILEIAERIPRALCNLCPTPQSPAIDASFTTESGLAPTPPAIYTRNGSPPAYWYGRTLFVPDDGDALHYLLLAASSDTFDGGGLFFDYRRFLLIGCAILVISWLWWLPFTLHVTRPLLRMSGFAEAVAEGRPAGNLNLPAARSDEIGRLGRALETMTRRLSQRMAGQSQFIRHIAHELNTSLGHCNLGLAVIEKKADGDLRERARRVMDELENLGSLTRDVLDFLRANSSPAKPLCRIMPLEPVVRDVIDAENCAGLDVRAHIEPDLLVWGDAQAARRALANALRNAIAYAAPMGPVIIGAAREAGGEIRLEVRDSGPGVAEDELDSIMEPFFRGARARLNHPCGSGLGLAIIRSCMEQCGGKAVCRNLKPQGFSVSMLFRAEKPAGN